MTQHTPGPSFVHNPTAQCSCYVQHGARQGDGVFSERIVYCPTHAAAPEMLEIIKQMFVDDGPAWDRAAEKARALLAKIEGKE